MEQSEARRRMEAGLLYDAGDAGILGEQYPCLDLLYEFNNTPPAQLARRQELLKQMLAEIGPGCYVEPPLRANWGGRHVHFGREVYANFNLTLVDDGHIYVGDGVMFGPNVTVATGAHPIDPQLRRTQMQYNKDVHIGENVWIGACAVILPGVTIGAGTVVGAGSVVTKDLPSNVVAVGNPCRVLRPIGPGDRKFYDRDKPVDVDIPGEGPA